MKILFLTTIFPYPLSNGGSIKTYHVLKHLGEHHEITLVSFIRTQEELSEQSHLASFCKDIRTVLIKRSFVRNTYDFMRSRFTKKPFVVLRDYSRTMQKVIDDVYKSGLFDLIYIDHLQMAQYVIDKPLTKVLDEHNIESDIIRRFRDSGIGLFARFLAYLEQVKLEQYEIEVCKRCDHVMTVTERDKKILIRHGVPQVTCVPIGVDSTGCAGIARNNISRHILFLGTMFWPPNTDAVEYFAAEIFPLIKRSVPDVQLDIIGKNPPGRIVRLGRDKQVKVWGFVADLTEHINRAGCLVVPLRIGGGMRVKILNALAWGLPVVSTSIGAEGIDGADENDILIRDTAESFAQAVIRVLVDPVLAGRMAESGKELVRSRYKWEAVLGTLDTVITQAPVPPLGGTVRGSTSRDR